MRMKNILPLAVLTILLFGAGCTSSDETSSQEESAPAQVQEMSERDIAYVKSVFQEKFPESSDALQVRITTSTPTHGRGFVDFGDGQDQLFFTTKIQMGWDVIFVRKMDYDCHAVEEYNFPSGMIEDCKEATGLTIADAQAIQKAMAEKHDKSTDETVIRITNQAPEHARGLVNFSADPNSIMQAGGAIFLAAKVDDAWEIVFDGNGTYECSLVEPHNFPSEMIEDCTP